MTGQSMLKIGPFIGGLNNVSDPSSIEDNELSLCQNFDFDVNGTLINRPPIQVESVQGPTAGKNIDILGHYISATGAVYLIGATDTALFYRSAGVWTSITTGLKPVAITQYLDKIWVVVDPTSVGTGGSWSFSAGWTAIAAMPRGASITVFKERLWLTGGKKDSVNGSRLYFSAIADGTTWNPADFVDVSKGDGESLVDLYSLSTNLFLFKDNSTYVLQYDTSPTKGTVTKVSNTIGVADVRCIVQYENILYIFHGGYLYEMVNYVYNKTNIKLSIIKNASGTYFQSITVSLVGNRVIVQYYNNRYVYYLLIRAWSQWISDDIAKLWKVPLSNPTTYITNSNVVGTRTTYDFVDSYVVGRTETNFCMLETKVFDFKAPNLFKKLYWWGADCISSGDMQAWVIPIRYNVSLTWDQIAAYTWDQIALNTWDRPAEIDNSITETITSPGAQRKFFKFIKALRFRNIYFRLKFTISDWVNPNEVFSITPVLNMKEQAPKTVN